MLRVRNAVYNYVFVITLFEMVTCILCFLSHSTLYNISSEIEKYNLGPDHILPGTLNKNDKNTTKI